MAYRSAEDYEPYLSFKALWRELVAAQKLYLDVTYSSLQATLQAQHASGGSTAAAAAVATAAAAAAAGFSLQATGGGASTPQVGVGGGSGVLPTNSFTLTDPVVKAFDEAVQLRFEGRARISSGGVTTSGVVSAATSAASSGGGSSDLIALPFQFALWTSTGDKKVYIFKPESFFGPRDGVWVDQYGKVKFHVEEVLETPYSNQVYRVKAVTLHLHAYTFMEATKIKPSAEKHKAVEASDGLRGYTVYLTVRDEQSKEVAFRMQLPQQDITRTDSAYSSTVVIECKPMPHVIPLHLALPEDGLKLVVDLMVYDRKGNVFVSRTGYAWIQNHAHFTHVYEANLLWTTESDMWLVVNFALNDSGTTTIRAVDLIMPLNRINQWFKTRYKLFDISTQLLEEHGKRHLKW